MKYPFLADLNLENSVVRKLSLYLDSIVRGNDQMLVTPLGKAMNPDVILQEFDVVFNSSTNKNLLSSDLLTFEMLNRDKFGPRSIQKPWSEREVSLRNYFSKEVIGPDLNTNPPDSKMMFKLRPVSYDEAVRLLKNNTSAGLPFYTRKGDLKKLYLIHRDDSDYSNLYPCILFTRTQEKGKTRDIWGYCMSATILEMQFYRPLLEYQRTLSWRSALIGPETVDRRVTELVNSSILRDVSLLSIDFSQYDATVKKKLQFEAFDYVKKLYQTSYHSKIDSIRNFFNECPILTPSGIWKGNHGVPSGSTFTNEIDSIAQFLVSTNSMYVFRENMQIQGDDGVYSVRKDNVDKVFNSFSDQGLKVSEIGKAGKTVISSTYCTYLQKFYSADYRSDNGIIGGIYSVYRALNRLVYQERWTDFEEFGILGKDYYSIRSICILENCKHHPLFRDLVKFVLSLDKYNLEYSQSGLNKYVSMLTETSGAEGILINQYGDDIRGISKFETVKLIKELA
uniref:RNA-dependent RNA polymerase n=1 Tax=Clinch picobirna-like virus 1 TaxID=2767021 RepID=A0A7G8YXC3_9VIRU|nr:RNA-dependent RNA polymerase [Clinch picobirna-like virus 1]